MQTQPNIYNNAPIIEPLKVIPDEIAAKPEKDAYVFPHIFNGVTNELTRRKLTVQENSNIKDRMNRICKDVLGWNKVVNSKLLNVEQKLESINIDKLSKKEMEG